MIYFFVSRGKTDLGKTKLMKLLYYADFGFFAEHSVPISGARYRAYPRGPVPEDALRELPQLVHDGFLESRQVPVGNYVQESYIPIHDLTIASLNNEEISKLNEVWERWKDETVSSIVSATHSEAPWASVDLYDSIPYEMAYFL